MGSELGGRGAFWVSGCFQDGSTEATMGTPLLIPTRCSSSPFLNLLFIEEQLLYNCWFLLYNNVNQIYVCPLPLEPPSPPQQCAVLLSLLDFLSLTVLPQELFYVGSKF